MFPLDEDRVLEFVRESTRFMTQEWLARAVFTRPQIHEDYGSIIVIPEGLPASTLVPLLLDASGVDLGIFAVYHRRPHHSDADPQLDPTAGGRHGGGERV